MIYLIGSLRNMEVPKVAAKLREAGYEVFDDWYAAGPEADDYWRDYERGRGRTYSEALQGLAADHVFQFDLKHLKRADAVVLMLPAGKSGHLELGWALGAGKRGYILLDADPERFDVMYKFAHVVTTDLKEIIEHEDLYRRTVDRERYYSRDSIAGGISGALHNSPLVAGGDIGGSRSVSVSSSGAGGTR